MLYGVKMCDEQISTKDIKANIFTPTMMINFVSVMCDTHIMNAMMIHHGDEPYHVCVMLFYF